MVNNLGLEAEEEEIEEVEEVEEEEEEVVEEMLENYTLQSNGTHKISCRNTNTENA